MASHSRRAACVALLFRRPAETLPLWCQRRTTRVALLRRSAVSRSYCASAGTRAGPFFLPRPGVPLNPFITRIVLPSCFSLRIPFTFTYAASTCPRYSCSTSLVLYKLGYGMSVSNRQAGAFFYFYALLHKRIMLLLSLIFLVVLVFRC